MTRHADIPNNRPTRRAAVTRCRAFTLIEVLVVVAIIALLISILLPSLAPAREATRSTVCLSQLRQMAVAATSYTNTYASSYPISIYTAVIPATSTSSERRIEYAWDYTRITDSLAPQTVIRPGLLWQGTSVPQIQQCPSFKGGSTYDGDPYTGYNYNSSYVGTYRKVKSGVKVRPARQDQIRRPGKCALFGDGEWSEGANKFMRSPWGSEKGARDEDVMGNTRAGGTQGYRHTRKTNVSFADGHGESRIQRYTETYDYARSIIPNNCGFLSAANDMYSLDGNGPPQQKVASR